MDELKLEKEIVSKKTIILGLGSIAVLFVSVLVSSVLELFFTKYKTWISLIYYFLNMVLLFFLFRKRLKRDFPILQKHLKKYLQFIIKNQLAMFIIFMAISYLVTIILQDPSSSLNQQEIEKLPVLMLIIISIIYAPFVEELLFRGSIRRIINNDILFIVISGTIFGLLHTISEASLIKILLLGLPYIFCGMYFAYMYVKTENLCVPMLCHFIHNSYAVIMLLLSRTF